MTGAPPHDTGHPMTLWFLARAAGFIALVAASASVSLGALASTQPTKRPEHVDRRVLRQMAHRSAGVVTLAMLALHVVLLVTDSYVNLSLAGALVPFTAGYRGFALGLGTLSAYGFLALALSGAVRGRLATSAGAARAWRVVHGSAYVVWPLAMAHGVLAGTDTIRWWTWPLYGGCALTVAVAAWIRLNAADAHHVSALPEARRQLTSGGHR